MSSAASARAAQFPRLLFFFHDTATTELYTLSLHDALPILSLALASVPSAVFAPTVVPLLALALVPQATLLVRSEEHTSELQSHVNLVCRLLLEKKKTESMIISKQAIDVDCSQTRQSIPALG